jgi:hypothetical protein
VKRSMQRSTRGIRCAAVVAPLAIAAAALCLPGCALTAARRPAPLTVPRIVEMSKAGLPAGEIVRAIRESGTVYRLSASQLVDLAKEGVPSDVLDHMQETYLEAVRRDAAYQEWRYWTPYRDYWYGGAPFDWPCDRVYIIRERPPSQRR